MINRKVSNAAVKMRIFVGLHSFKPHDMLQNSEKKYDSFRCRRVCVITVSEWRHVPSLGKRISV